MNKLSKEERRYDRVTGIFSLTLILSVVSCLVTIGCLLVGHDFWATSLIVFIVSGQLCCLSFKKTEEISPPV